MYKSARHQVFENLRDPKERNKRHCTTKNKERSNKRHIYIECIYGKFHRKLSVFIVPRNVKLIIQEVLGIFTSSLGKFSRILALGVIACKETSATGSYQKIKNFLKSF